VLKRLLPTNTLHLTPVVQGKKYKSLRVRTISTVALIAGFLVVVYAGHVPLMCLLVVMQVGWKHKPACI
jgi:hypothetical protein